MKRFKVFKKLCSLALILSMLVSLIPMNVFATEVNTDGNESTTDDNLTIINPEQEGKATLTINKQDKDTKEPIEGIEFTIYQIFSMVGEDEEENKILDYSFTEDFNQFAINKSLTVESIREMDGTQLNELVGDLELYIKTYNEQEVNTEKIEGISCSTNSYGMATFENLSLGYYLVVETKSDKVSSVAPSFLVSVPTTDKNEAGQSYWNYDFTVTPKNILNLTQIILQKTDGKNLIDGSEFILEKESGKDEEGKSIWETVKPKIEVKDGKLVVDGFFNTGVYQFRETKQPEGYILDHDNSYQFKIEENEDKTKLIFTPITKEGFTTTDEGFTLTVINEKPIMEKVADKLTAGLGEKVRWEITTTVPSLINELKTFTITDTLTDGLKFSEDINLEVVQGEKTDGTDNTLENALKVDSLDIIDSFTFTEENEDLFYVWTVVDKKLVIKFNPKKLTPSTDIVVSYDTEITPEAVIFPSGNDNEATLEYSISTSPDSTTKTIRDDDVVYSFGLQVNKTDNDKKPLSDAKFTLCKKGTTQCHERVSGTNGIIKFPQLAAGEYVLTEIQAPNGYNLLKEEITIKINAHEEADGLIADVIAIVNGKEIALEPNNSSAYYYELNVVNNKGFTLPETGGMGTVIFTVAGLGIMGLAGAAYMVLKRKESQQ